MTKLNKGIEHTKDQIVEIIKTKKSPIKLNLACGPVIKNDCLNIDILYHPNVDLIVDLEKYPLPFESSSIDEIYIEHFIEHVKDFYKFMDEVYRILKPQTHCFIVSPYYTSVRATQDCTHIRSISENTFAYLNKDWRIKEKVDYYDIECDFDMAWGYVYEPEWEHRNFEAQMYAVKHYFNVVRDIQVRLTKK